jgi:hypothetical protein
MQREKKVVVVRKKAKMLERKLERRNEGGQNEGQKKICRKQEV